MASDKTNSIPQYGMQVLTEAGTFNVAWYRWITTKVQLRDRNSFDPDEALAIALTSPLVMPSDSRNEALAPVLQSPAPSDGAMFIPTQIPANELDTLTVNGLTRLARRRSKVFVGTPLDDPAIDAAEIVTSGTRVSVGRGRATDGESGVNLHSVLGTNAVSAQMVRYAGVNGQLDIKNTGTGILSITQFGVGNIVETINGLETRKVIAVGLRQLIGGGIDDGATKLQVEGGIKALSGAGAGFRIGVNQVVGARATGWTASSGITLLGGITAAAAPAAAALYSQAQMQTVMDELSQARALLVSLQAAMTTHGLIG